MPNQITLPASDADKLRYVEMLESGDYSEDLLETALIVAPDLFDPAPYFCGRQLRAGSGTLDLFGLVGKKPFRLGFYVDPDVVWGDSFPTVYELKARKLRPGDVGQVMDYALALGEMSAEDLAWHLIRSSKDDTGIPRMEPGILQEVSEQVAHPRLWVSSVLVGTDYDENVARLAKHTEVEIYTVSELCRGYRVRHSMIRGDR